MRLLRNQHVSLCLIGAVVLIAIKAFMAYELLDSGLPSAELEDRAMRLNFLLILPYMAVLIMWSLAILLSALGFGFRTGQFGRRSRAWVPRVCIGLFLFHRYAFILLLKQIHGLLFPEART